MSTSNRFAMAGRIGAHVRWGNTVDRAAEDRWLREVRAEHPDLDHETAVKLAESRRKAFYSRLAQKSVAARRARTSTPGTQGRAAA